MEKITKEPQMPKISQGGSKLAKKKTPPAEDTAVKKVAKLTMKQKKLVQGISEGKTQKRAAIEAGYSEKSAETIASQEMKKTQVKAALTDLMEKAGLSDDVLLAKHVELLNAQKTISTLSGKDADSKTVDFVDVPDYQTQKSALEMAYKLKGAFVEKKEVVFPDGISLQVVFGDE